VIAVLCRSSHGDTAYPFDDDDRDVAARFAAFLTAEVDSAEVVPFETVGPATSVVWLSPIKELLNWYEADKRRGPS
jgi:hypothetical protein